MRAGCTTCGHRFNSKVSLSQLSRVQCPKCKKRTTTTADQVPNELEIADLCEQIRSNKIEELEPELERNRTPGIRVCRVTTSPHAIVDDVIHFDSPYWATEF
jgi:predicted  nucleic acid-binding Zn-ribbon protein